MIQVENLTKRYGRFLAVDNLSFEVKKGEIVGFLGPNGAGKTTTMRILAGFFPPTGGTAQIAGLDIFQHSLAVRQRIGYMPENVPAYPDMRVCEYLRFRGALKGLRGRQLRRRLDEVVELCNLGEMRDRLIGRLSKGYHKRVGLADSLIHEPELLILDEPTIGLDPNQIRQFRHIVKELAPRYTVLLSSHILPEVEMVCERVLIINRGRIIASDTPGNLAGLMKGNERVFAELKGPADDISHRLQALPGVLRVSLESSNGWNRFICECERGQDIRCELFKQAAANNWELRELTAEQTKLEDVFVAMIRQVEDQQGSLGNGTHGGPA